MRSNVARENSVKQLCDLYRVVIAIGVGLAFHEIVAIERKPIPIDFDSWQLFVAFLITIIPFFHGTVRHLFATYVEDGGSTSIKDWAILIDYYLLFIGGGVFIALSAVIKDVDSFMVLLIIVLAVDVVWGAMASIGFAGTKSQKAEIKWMVINFTAVVIILAFMLIEPGLNGGAGLEKTSVKGIILLICVVRTVVDYGWNIGFYCPSLSRDGSAR